MSGARDLSGVWYGRYEATGYAETNNFIAQIEDGGGAISGVITEPDTTGQAEVRRAFVNGLRSGSTLAFVKQYDGAVLAHAVRYAGAVNDEGTEIRGQWRIIRESGSFVMTREIFAAEELEEAEKAEIVAGNGLCADR